MKETDRPTLIEHLSGWAWWEYAVIGLILLFVLYVVFRAMNDWFGHIDMG